MRVLDDHELLLVGGAGVDTYTLNMPFGATVTSQLEPNSSTTITISGQGWGFQWNSAEFVTCTIIGTGVGVTIGTLTGGNVPIGMLVDAAVSYGCTKAFSHTDEDGDEF